MARRPGVRTTAGSRATVAAAFTSFLLLVVLVPAGARAASGQVTVGSDGTVTVAISASVPDGSVLRLAMDGNFTPIVDALTTNASQRASLLAQIAVAESTPFLGSLFGNQDGTVSPGEVSSFENLLAQEAQLLPTSGFSGGSFLSFTLDGNRATSTRVGGITFQNATGPADSTSPVGVTTTITDSFAYQGSNHVLAFTANVSTGGLPISLLTGEVGLTVTTPTATAVTGTEGFDQRTISNDPFGWGAGSVSGTFLPTTTGTLSVSFDAAFPTGDLLVALPFVVAGLVGAALLYRRRRRKSAPAA